jgi:hypothetical protein
MYPHDYDSDFGDGIWLFYLYFMTIDGWILSFLSFFPFSGNQEFAYIHKIIHDGGLHYCFGVWSMVCFSFTKKEEQMIDTRSHVCMYIDR